jgi:hypothetical protein
MSEHPAMRRSVAHRRSSISFVVTISQLISAPFPTTEGSSQVHEISEYERLQRASDEERVKSEQARLPLEQHIAIQKC